MKEFDAIVLGAGPAGASAAFSLVQTGMRVAVVEKAAFPRRKVCGEFVSATTFPVLDAMGIGDRLREKGGPPTRRVGFYAGDRIVAAPMPKVPEEESFGRTLARAVLDPLLLETAAEAGAEIYQPWKAAAMEREGGIWTVTLTQGDHSQRLVAPRVVAAHGSWELGTLPTLPTKRNRPDDVLAFKGFFEGAVLPDDIMILASFPGGYGGAVHRDADTVGLSFCVRRDVLEACRARYGGPTAWDSLLRHVMEHCRGVREAFTGACLEAPAKAAGPLRPGIRPIYQDGIFRAGNAAGEAHPTIAEGISMAIQSGWLLGGCVGAGGSMEDVGRRYERAWRHQFAARIRTADLYARVCMNPALGRLAAGLLGTLPPLLTAAAAWSGKTRTLSGLMVHGRSEP